MTRKSSKRTHRAIATNRTNLNKNLRRTRAVDSQALIKIISPSPSSKDNRISKVKRLSSLNKVSKRKSPTAEEDPTSNLIINLRTRAEKKMKRSA